MFNLNNTLIETSDWKWVENSLLLFVLKNKGF